MSNEKNILFINFGGIGDEILFLPTILSVKQNFPNSKISLCLEPRSKSVMDLSSLIDEIFEVDIKNKNKYIELLKFIFKARKKHFDIAVSSGANKLVAVILFLIGAKKRFGFKTGFLSKLLLTKEVDLNKNQYASKMYHDLVNDLTQYRNEIPKIEIENVEKIENSVLIHPGVSKISIKKNIFKTISAEKWAQVINLLLEKNKKVFLIGGNDDKEVIDIILKQVDINNSNFKNLFGTTKNLKDLAVLIKKSEKFVCSDSAPMHIGVGLGIETYAIFGPTDEKKLIPKNINCYPIIGNCNCRPCLWDKRQTTCEKLDCLKIEAKQIVEKILK